MMGQTFSMENAPTSPTRLQRRIQQFLDETGTTKRGLSLAAGLSESLVKKIMKPGSAQSPRGVTLSAIAKVLDVDVSELLDANIPNQRTNVPVGNARIARNAPKLPDFTALPRDVPVLGAAPSGLDGGFHLHLADNPIDWTRRMPGLIGASTVFALYCVGESMAPWRQPGDLIYVSRTRPPQVGSHVVVMMEPARSGDAPVCYVRKLIRSTADQIDLEQYFPRRVTPVPRERCLEILRVMEWEEIAGL